MEGERALGRVGVCSVSVVVGVACYVGVVVGGSGSRCLVGVVVGVVNILKVVQLCKMF